MPLKGCGCIQGSVSRLVSPRGVFGQFITMRVDFPTFKAASFLYGRPGWILRIVHLQWAAEK